MHRHRHTHTCTHAHTTITRTRTHPHSLTHTLTNHMNIHIMCGHEFPTRQPHKGTDTQSTDRHTGTDTLSATSHLPKKITPAETTLTHLTQLLGPPPIPKSITADRYGAGLKVVCEDKSVLSNRDVRTALQPFLPSGEQLDELERGRDTLTHRPPKREKGKLAPQSK